jgi:hypothetical protein
MARRLVIAALMVLAAFSLAMPEVVHAQGVPVWQRTYPQNLEDGCVYLVAQWSDGTYTWVPWSCPAGVAPIRQMDRSRPGGRPFSQLSTTYPGCIENVVAWNDGIYTWVPFSCPPGVVYVKPGTFPVAAPAALPSSPVLPPPPVGGAPPPAVLPPPGGAAPPPGALPPPIMAPPPPPGY